MSLGPWLGSDIARFAQLRESIAAVSLISEAQFDLTQT